MRYCLLLILLAGCATPEERAAKIINRHGPYCETLGFVSGSDGWRQCVMSEENSRRARRGVVCYQTATTLVCN